MRGFAQTMFNALLGWIRTLVEGVWSLLFSHETQSWLLWVADNWLTLVVLLCLMGVFVDFFVWFLRWRPYYVWATSLRRIRRFFGGRREQGADAAHGRPRPNPVPARARMAGRAAQEQFAGARVSQAAIDTQPMAPILAEPQAAADTIFVRPRITDEQYVRRFARPDPEPQPEAEPIPEASFQGIDGDYGYEQGPVAGVYEEYAEEPAAGPQEESWAPDPSLQAADMPLHPGIDYQALSRQYGWHPPAQAQDEPQREETWEEAWDEAVEEPQDQPGQAWDFSGLKSFSPYRASNPAPAAASSPRTERSRKAREESNTLSKLKSGLGHIARRAGKALTVDDEAETGLIDGLPPPIDKKRAFHAPVYPNRPGEKRPQSPDFRKDD